MHDIALAILAIAFTIPFGTANLSNTTTNGNTSFCGIVALIGLILCTVAILI